MATNRNLITCKICNKELKLISNTHLKLHNLTEKKYRKIFLNAELASKRMKNKVRLFQKNFLHTKKHNKNVSKALLNKQTNEEREVKRWKHFNKIQNECACGCGQICRTKYILGHQTKFRIINEDTKQIMKIKAQMRNLNPKYNKMISERMIKNNPMKKKKARDKIKKSRLKQIFPFKDTSIEVKLQNILNQNNIQFEKHKAIFGQPDIFIDPNICIFADGDYWHKYPKGTKRDKQVNRYLRKNNYIVLRFWEHEINNNLQKCLNEIKFIINGVVFNGK